ncbi:MAG TPA: hypothetical protein VGS58_22510, partial [Candidatus Sulfopaludibacter sp.]|nr:hypothetical protein [Candidatus Sulfopaludibacter sp.]
DAWWAKSGWRSPRGCSGFHAALATPEYLEGLANKTAVQQQMTDAEAQRLYRLSLDQLTGKLVAFDCYVQIGSEVYAPDSARAFWTIYLYDAEGNRYRPARADWNRETVSEDGDWVRWVVVRFDNAGVDGKALLGPHTKSLTLAISGALGAAAARFVFDPKKK